MGRKHNPAHGTRAKYRHGCRCDECRGANADAKRGQSRHRGALPQALANSREVRAARANTCIVPWCTGLQVVGKHCRQCDRRITRHGDPARCYFDLDLAERLKASFVVEGECWIWQKALNAGGYGVSWDGERTVVAHRLAYETFIGPIPEGLHLDHLCRVRACINPAHLEPVTQAENNRRSNAIRWAS